MIQLSVEDVAKSMGRPASEFDSEQVMQAITDAETLIRVQLGDPALLDQDVLKLVVRLAVADYLRNPEGTSEESWTVDDASHSRKRNGVGLGRVAILPEWIEWLRPAARSSSFSIAPG